MIPIKRNRYVIYAISLNISNNIGLKVIDTYLSHLTSSYFNSYKIKLICLYYHEKIVFCLQM